MTTDTTQFKRFTAIPVLVIGSSVFSPPPIPNYVGESVVVRVPSRQSEKSSDEIDREINEMISRFSDLADKWEMETAGLSTLDDIMSHPSYREILDMGDDALPMILSRMQKRGGFWFGALDELADDNPLDDDDFGDRDRMIAAWVSWGKAHDLC